jgi:hypothetical protein
MSLTNRYVQVKPIHNGLEQNYHKSGLMAMDVVCKQSDRSKHDGAAFVRNEYRSYRRNSTSIANNTLAPRRQT